MMNDLISRQEVVDMFQSLAYDDCNKGVSTSWADAYSECANMISEFPTAQPNTCAYWDKESNLCALYRPSAQTKLLKNKEGGEINDKGSI